MKFKPNQLILYLPHRLAVLDVLARPADLIKSYTIITADQWLSDELTQAGITSWTITQVAAASQAGINRSAAEQLEQAGLKLDQTKQLDQLDRLYYWCLKSKLLTPILEIITADLTAQAVIAKLQPAQWHYYQSADPNTQALIEELNSQNIPVKKLNLRWPARIKMLGLAGLAAIFKSQLAIKKLLTAIYIRLTISNTNQTKIKVLVDLAGEGEIREFKPLLLVLNQLKGNLGLLIKRPTLYKILPTILKTQAVKIFLGRTRTKTAAAPLHIVQTLLPSNRPNYCQHRQLIQKKWLNYYWQILTNNDSAIQAVLAGRQPKTLITLNDLKPLSRLIMYRASQLGVKVISAPSTANQFDQVKTIAWLEAQLNHISVWRNDPPAEIIALPHLTGRTIYQTDHLAGQPPTMVVTGSLAQAANRTISPKANSAVPICCLFTAQKLPQMFDQLPVLINVLAAAELKINRSIHLIIKVHPKESLTWYRFLNYCFLPSTVKIKIIKYPPLTAWWPQIDCLLTESSFTAQEAAWLNRPAVVFDLTNKLQTAEQYCPLDLTHPLIHRVTDSQTAISVLTQLITQSVSATNQQLQNKTETDTVLSQYLHQINGLPK